MLSKIPMTSIRRLLSTWFPIFIFCVLVFVQACFPSLDKGISFPLKDKLEHAFVYGLLAVLFFRACRITWPHLQAPNLILAASIGFAALYGAMDELHQAFVSTRHASLLDLLADVAGAGVGAFLARIFYFKRTGKQKIENSET
ncbi:VanZ family protein [Desulfosarcina sp. OttesenSCG-928-A07]|nr:VanZ family protein [Desulfosarcina sp. OttesenSCG-928-A07]